MSLLSARSVAVELDGRRVLEDVDFSINAGEMVGLLGPNGAGKTTLLRALAGLQPMHTGKVQLLGQDLSAYSLPERARRLAFLPQSGLCHWPIAVAEVVALGRLPHRAPWARVPATDAVAVQRAMDAADVAHLANRAAAALSGGERSRVLLARALAVESQLLLADEPTAGLDPAQQMRVMEVLRVRAQAGTGVVVVLHDLTLAARFCDRLILLHEGRVVADDVPARVLTPENLQAVYEIDVHITESAGDWLVVPVRRMPR